MKNIRTLSYTDFKARYEVNIHAKPGDKYLLGVSSQGKMYLGYDKLLNRQVAVKTTYEDHGLLSQVARVASFPPHPNLIRYLDGFRVQADDGEFDMAVMPYYPSGNLGDLLFRRPDGQAIKATQLDSILKGILEGIRHLHERGALHGNLKPENILMAEHRGMYMPVLSDYGELNPDNFRYLAPEAATGRTVFSNSDFWSFGVILFRILTGEWPFYFDGPGEEFRIKNAQQIYSEDMEQVFSKVAGLPPRYVSILRRCLEVSVSDRADKAEELIAILNGPETNSTELPKDSIGKDEQSPPAQEVIESEPKAVKGSTKKGSRTGAIVAFVFIALYNIYRYVNPPMKPTYDDTIKTEEQQLYFKEFGWNISIPENFEKVSDQEVAKMYSQKLSDLESSTGIKAGEPLKTLFMCRNGNNSMEAFYEAYQPDKTLSFEEVMTYINEITVKSVMRSAPASMKIDTFHLYKTIDNQEFYVFRFKVDISSKVKYHGAIYRKLFKNKLLAVNILYVNEEKGLDLIMAMKKSTFQKSNP